MASYLGNNPDNIIKVRKANYRYVATAGQTVFSGSDSNGLTMQNNTSDIEVFLNGVLLDQTDYTATISAITLTSGATVGDIVEVITNTEFQVSSLYTKEEVDLKVSVKADTTTVNTALATKANTSSLATVATSGSYNDLTNKPAITPTAISDQANSSTGYLDLPAGTTAQRPATPNTGYARFNTDIGAIEVYNGSFWSNYLGTYSIDILSIAGGGSGGVGYGGGGGAGGVVYSSGTTVTPSNILTITIGAGGTTPSYGDTVDRRGNSGSNTTVTGTASLTAIGGGGGGCENGTLAGLSGGSGGGGTYNSAGGSATSGQGSNGGTGISGGFYPCGGGGGAGGAGGNAASNTPGSRAGAGGAGTNTYSVFSTATSTGVAGYYAGGGGGGAGYDNGGGYGGYAGSGGGGAGADDGTYGGGVNSVGGNGTINSGGGGGGSNGGSGNNRAAGNGGSGVVIVRYFGAQKGVGGTITQSGGYTYHTFTSSGTFTA